MSCQTECDHLSKHVACYECDLIDIIWFWTIAFLGLGPGLSTLEKIYFGWHAMLSDLICSIMWFKEVDYST